MISILGGPKREGKVKLQIITNKLVLKINLRRGKIGGMMNGERENPDPYGN